MKFSITLCLCLFMWVQQARLQPNYIRFNSLTVDQNLTQGNVYQTFQSQNGFIWFGTQDGLNRFDGFQIVSFFNQKDNKHSISNNNILAITEDDQQNIWIGTKGGLNKYDQNTGRFTSWKYAPDAKTNLIKDNLVKSLYFDAKTKSLWIGTANGLDIWNQKTNQVKHYDITNSVLKNNFIGCFYADEKKGTIWIGTYAGLAKASLEEQKIIRAFVKKHDDPSSIGGNSVVGIQTKDENTIWLALKNDGLDVFDIRSEKFRREPYYNVSNKKIKIHSILADDNNILWMGTDQGLIKYDIAKRQSSIYLPNTYDVHTILDKVILSLYKDKGGNIWCGTFGKGVSWFDYDQNKFEYIQVILKDKEETLPRSIWSMYVEDKNRIWVGTENNGAVLMDSSYRIIKELKCDPQSKTNHLSSNVVNFITKDKFGDIWFGTDGGLDRFNPKTEKSDHFLTNNSKSRTNKYDQILHLFPDDDILWMGTLGSGLIKMNLKDNSTERITELEVNKNLDISNVYCIFKDKEKNFWIGTEIGLFQIDKKTNILKGYPDPEDVANTTASKIVQSINQTSDGLLWIGIQGGGLKSFNPKTGKFKVWYKEDGLPNNEVYTVIPDENNNIWLSTNQGVSCYSPAKNTFRNFGISDGLQGLEFNAQAGFKDANGKIYFGGQKGFNTLIPSKLKDNQYKPSVMLTKLLVFNKEVLINPEICKNYGKDLVKENGQYYMAQSISTLKELTLSYKEEIFAIEFSATHYTDPQRNKYKYMLEGLEKDWNLVDATKRFVLYTTLSPGTYTLLVKACNPDGIWGEPIRLELTITPPFYQTIWFYAICLVAVILGIFVFIKYREKKLVWENARLDAQVKQRTLELEMSNQEILTQRDEIESQNNRLKRQNDKIMESMQYARKIQTAILPPEEIVSNSVSKYFILNRPKEVVSGDFYWVKSVENLVFVAVGDCTGHGVPGAFMSILGTSLLNEIINKQIENNKIDELSPAFILRKLNDSVRESLHQVGRIDEAKDGMDISICLIDKLHRKITFAGANNEIYFIHEGKFCEYKADKNPVGISFVKTISFTNIEFDYSPNDMLYLFSDGFKDQFGGHHGRKFLSKNFKHLLFELHPLSIEEQAKKIELTLTNWQGDYEQLDDIMVMGIKF